MKGARVIDEKVCLVEEDVCLLDMIGIMIWILIISIIASEDLFLLQGFDDTLW